MGLLDVIQGFLDDGPNGPLQQLSERPFEEIAAHLTERVRSMSVLEYTAFSAKLMSFADKNPSTGKAVDDLFRALWRLKQVKNQGT